MNRKGKNVQPSQPDMQAEHSLHVHPRSPMADLLWNRPIPQLAALGLEQLEKAITPLLPVNHESPDFGSQELHLHGWTV